MRDHAIRTRLFEPKRPGTLLALVIDELPIGIGRSGGSCSRKDAQPETGAGRQAAHCKVIVPAPPPLDDYFNRRVIDRTPVEF